MKTLFIGSDLDRLGGIQRLSRDTVDVLRDTGEVEVIDVGLNGTRRRAILGMATTTARLARSRPDAVVLSHVGLGPLSKGAAALRVPVAVMIHGIEVWGPWQRRYARVLRSAHAWSVSNFTLGQARRRYQVLTGTVTGARARDAFFELPPREPDGVLRVWTVARFADPEGKGIDAVLEAIRLLADRSVPVEYHLVGDGPNRVTVERWVGNLRLNGHVRFHGASSDHALLEVVRDSDVHVLASRYADGDRPRGEGLGIATLEASAAGRVPLVSADAGAPEPVMHASTGFHIDPARPGEIADILARLAAHPALVRDIGASARRWATDHASRNSFSQRVSAAFDALVSGHAPSEEP